MKARVKRNRQWSEQELDRLDKGMFSFALDLDRRSKMIAPKDTGALRNSSKVRRAGLLTYILSFGNTRVPYARKQYYEHKSASLWMERAAENIVRGNLRRYFK